MQSKDMVIIMRKYDVSDVEFLQLQQEPKVINGLPIIIKSSPTEPRMGCMDHHELVILKNHWVAREEEHEETQLTPMEALQKMRDGMGFPNKNLTTVEIHTKFETIKVGENDVGLWRYYPRASQYKKDRPCFIFLHGGGWIGGTPYTVENPCRLIAELADAVVFNVDYALAPEKKYPNGFNDCFGALEHIYKNAEAYGIDRTKIALGGDSAGGNLTAAVAMKDRDQGTNMVALQVLIYACTVFKATDVNWSIDEYEMSEEQRAMIDPCIAIARPREGGEDISMGSLYFDDAENQYSEPYASPYLAKCHKGLPQALSVACEYDGLRIQDELYAKKLVDAGVQVKSIRYKGVTHAFIDRLGFVPQAEDLCIEIADAIKKL